MDENKESISINTSKNVSFREISTDIDSIIELKENELKKLNVLRTYCEKLETKLISNKKWYNEQLIKIKESNNNTVKELTQIKKYCNELESALNQTQFYLHRMKQNIIINDCKQSETETILLQQHSLQTVLCTYPGSDNACWMETPAEIFYRAFNMLPKFAQFMENIQQYGNYSNLLYTEFKKRKEKQQQNISKLKVFLEQSKLRMVKPIWNSDSYFKDPHNENLIIRRTGFVWQFLSHWITNGGNNTIDENEIFGIKKDIIMYCSKTGSQSIKNKVMVDIFLTIEQIKQYMIRREIVQVINIQNTIEVNEHDFQQIINLEYQEFVSQSKYINCQYCKNNTISNHTKKIKTKPQPIIIFSNIQPTKLYIHFPITLTILGKKYRKFGRTIYHFFHFMGECLHSNNEVFDFNSSLNKTNVLRRITDTSHPLKQKNKNGQQQYVIYLSDTFFH